MDESNSQIEKLGQKARNVPPIIRIPILVAALFIAVYWIWTDSGPYWWIASLQASYLNGEHYLALSWLFTIMVPIIPAAILIQILARVIKKPGNGRT